MDQVVVESVGLGAHQRALPLHLVVGKVIVDTVRPALSGRFLASGSLGRRVVLAAAQTPQETHLRLPNALG